MKDVAAPVFIQPTPPVYAIIAPEDKEAYLAHSAMAQDPLHPDVAALGVSSNVSLDLTEVVQPLRNAMLSGQQNWTWGYTLFTRTWTAVDACGYQATFTQTLYVCGL